MKKLFLCFIFLLIWTGVWGQNNPTYFDIPRKMVYDSTGVANRAVRDFYFNTGSDSTGKFYNGGTVDLNFSHIMTGTGTATLTVEAYGIIRVVSPKIGNPVGADSVITAYIDSTRLASFTVDSTWRALAVDGLFTTFKMYDGIRVVWKSSTQDSVDVWSLLRTRFKWWEGR